MNFDDDDLIRSGHDFDFGFFSHVIFGNQRAGMVRFEGIFDADADAGAFQWFRRFRVNRFHADVSKLICHVVIGEADRNRIFDADKIRISGGKMEFFVNNCLISVHFDRDLAERHFGIAAIKLAHNPFRAFRVARDDGQRFGKINAFQHDADAVVNRQIAGIMKAAQIDAGGVQAVILDDIRGVEGRMRFADGGQQFAGGLKNILFIHVPGDNHVGHAVQIGSGLVDALRDVGVCGFEV